MIRKLLLTSIFILLLVAPTKVSAGILWVEVGVNGLTCSMCTLSVEKSISRLPFVERVEMSLENTNGRVYLKPDMSVDMNMIAKAVVDAGFSVRFVHVVIDQNDLKITPTGTFECQGQTFQWIEFKGTTTREITLRLVDADFLPRKDRSFWKEKLAASEITETKEVLHVVLKK